MAFGPTQTPGHSDRHGAPLAEINMVPLIDVMLVLLVIFLVTAPLLTHSVRIDLPRASAHADTSREERVQVSIDAQGGVLWNGEPLDRAGWRSRMQALASQEPPPQLQLRADGAVPYARVATLMADAASAGLARIGFVTVPESE